MHVPAQNIVLYGRSLGSGPSTHLAAKTALVSKDGAEYGSENGPVGGLILHAPFLSVFRVVVDTGCTIFGDKFPNIDVIPMVKSPTILVHGTSDQIVPFHHSERLFQVIPKEYRSRPLYIEGMSHNNVHSQVRPMFVDRLCEYLEHHVWPSAVVARHPSSNSYSTKSTASPTGSSKVRKRVWKIVEADDQFSDESPQNLPLIAAAV